MKTLAIVVFSFLAGIFAPELTSLQNLSLPKIHLGSIDPLAVAMIALVAWGISKARAKHKGGKS
jgi:predicted transporter